MSTRMNRFLMALALRLSFISFTIIFSTGIKKDGCR